MIPPWFSLPFTNILSRNQPASGGETLFSKKCVLRLWVGLIANPDSSR